MHLLEKKGYGIFTSREGDWDVAAYMQGEAVGILYQGHSRSQTFRAILEDLLGGQVLAKEVDMGGGGDWSPNCRTGGKNAVLERGRNAEGSHHVVSEQDSWNRSDRRGVHPERILGAGVRRRVQSRAGVPWIQSGARGRPRCCGGERL